MPATACVAGLAAAWGCGGDAPSAPPTPGPRVAAPLEPLPDEAHARGLRHVDVSGGAAKEFILEANGGGVALLDLGDDGDLDVVFGQGCGSLAALLDGPGADLAVYTNDGRGHFAPAGGPGLAGWWTGLAAGDLDGDGDTDLVAGGLGSLRVLWQEDGRLVPGAELLPDAERFVPGARRPGAPDATARRSEATRRAPTWVTSLALADLDGDGALDLYVGCYLDFEPSAPPAGVLGSGPLASPCTWRGAPVFCGPRGLTPQLDRVFMNRRAPADEQRAPRFVDESVARLPGQEAAYALGVLAFDADSDGDRDLFVANDSAPNLLWINDGTGHFVERGFVAGVALGADGQREAGMGVAAGDVDGDGRPDLAVTNFSEEPTRLYLAADVGFRDATHRAGLGRASRATLAWGVHLTDLDGDGELELFSANGHVHPAADGPYTGTSYGQPDTLWRLAGGRRVEPVLAATERSLLGPASGSRASALGDLDGDGRPDLVVVRIDGPAALGMNRFVGASWLEVRLEGTTSPRDGSGARVTVVAEGRAQHREATTSGSFQASSTPHLHFGLGAARAYESLEVIWPSGLVEHIGAGAVGRRLWLREGDGLVRAEALESNGERATRAPAATVDVVARVAGGGEKTNVVRDGGGRPSPASATPMSEVARVELLGQWAWALAVGEPGSILEEGLALVGAAQADSASAGGALARDAEALSLVARALHAAGERERAYTLLADDGAATVAEARDESALDGRRSSDLRTPRSASPRAELALARAALALEDDALEAALALVVGAPAEGADAAREPMVLFPKEPLAWLVAGRALARMPERAREAQPYLERFVGLAPLHPEAPSALHALAQLALARRAGPEAEALHTEAERRARWHEVFRARAAAKRASPMSPEPRLALAELWRAVGALDHARTELEELLEVVPGNQLARGRLAELAQPR